ncbi:MurR/RpiR family transcriptional regulator [Pseudoroseomonas wenyumeiae]
MPNLLALLEQRGPGLSPQFQRIAQYCAANPDEVALAPLRVLAGHVQAHPSALVRLAKSLGYDGFREMQRVFKAAVFDRARGVTSRTSLLHRALSPRGTGADPARAVVAHEMAGLQTMLERLPAAELEAATARLVAARLVWIGADEPGRAVAWHLRWLLTRRQRPVVLLDAAPEVARRQLATASAEDAVVLVSLDTAGAGRGPRWRRRRGRRAAPRCCWAAGRPPRPAACAFPAAPAAGQLPPLSPALALANILAAPPMRPADTTLRRFRPLGW